MSDANSYLPTTTIGELIDQGIIAVTAGFACGEHNSDGHGVLQVRPFNVTISGRISLSEQKHIPAPAAEGKPTLLKRDILFNNTNTKELVGKTALWDGPESCVFSNHMTRIRVLNPVFPPQFLATAVHAHWLLGRSQMLARAHVAQSSILGERFREIEVPWPSPDEQVVFARLFDVLSRSSAAEREVLKVTQDLKCASMLALFTYGLRGEVQKETEIGPLPQSWEPRAILELCEIWSGGTPRKSVAEYWKGDIPWVSGKDLKSPSLDDAIDHVTQAGVEKGSRLAPTGSVLLLVRGMGLAKDLPVAVINRPMAFNQDVKALVSRGDFTGQFLRSGIYARKERLLSQIVPSAHGTMTLNLNDVENFKIACPSDLTEADEIVTILEIIDRKIGLHRQKIAIIDNLFKAVLYKLMTGALSVTDLDLTALASKDSLEVSA